MADEKGNDAVLNRTMGIRPSFVIRSEGHEEIKARDASTYTT